MHNSYEFNIMLRTTYLLHFEKSFAFLPEFVKIYKMCKALCGFEMHNIHFSITEMYCQTVRTSNTNNFTKLLLLVC